MFVLKLILNSLILREKSRGQIVIMSVSHLDHAYSLPER